MANEQPTGSSEPLGHRDWMIDTAPAPVYERSLETEIAALQARIVQLEAQNAELTGQVAPVHVPVKVPCYRYHPTEGTRLCQTEADVEALGSGWLDVPPDGTKLPDATT